MLNKSLAVKMFSSVVLVTSFSQGAMADFIVKKTNTSGFTAPEYVRAETCEVNDNFTEISRVYGTGPGNSTKTTRIINESVSNGVYDIIRNSYNSDLDRSPNNLCDAPSTVITATYNGNEFVLFRSGGCGSDRLERTDPWSRTLVDIVNKHCSVTYDFK